MADKPVRFGVVGTGGWANFVHLATNQTHPRAQIACSPARRLRVVL